ncbi:MAG TPA: Hsp70 family protein [Pirellulales bacterium]|nr:Hsp70 family protein [Pirellulales bacterium]
MSRTRAVGIDLGTTYSAVAWLSDAGKTVMAPNNDGDILTPSLVLFDDREVIVGKEAGKLGRLRPARFAECVKRDMGSPVYSHPISEEYMPPEVIQAWILKQLKADAVRAVGPDFRAVITVPAFFDEPRRKATADAGLMANLPVLDVVNEPTAAALAFGEELGYLTAGGEVREPLKVLVYDLGGGTFDVTLLEMRPGDLRTLATDGDVRLGGRDWDMRLADHAAEAFIHEHREDPRTNPASLHRLLNEVEEAKRTLSARQNATIRVDHAGSSTTVKVTRDQFEQLTADLLQRTAYTTRQVLAAAGLTWNDVQRVLLVGGSTRMPMVGRMLEELSGIVPDKKVHPDEAVARGAAIYAGYLLATQPGSNKPPPFEVTNVNSHSLGIEGVDPSTGRKRNAIIIPRNTPLPAKVKERFSTKTAGQRSVVVQVLEGESSLPSECTSIGRTALRDLPPGLPAAWPVEITYEYGTNGRLNVSAMVPGTDREVTLQLEREGSMSDERLGRWKQAISASGGFDDFTAMIAEELNLRQAAQPEFIPVSEAEHITAASPTAIPSPAVSAPTAAAPAAPQRDPTKPVLVSPGPQGFVPTAPSTQPAAASIPANRPVAPAAAPSPIAPPPAAYDSSTPSKPLARKSGLAAPLNALGFLVSAVIGLVLGYYVLVFLNPDANILNLPSSWFPWQAESPPNLAP